MCELCRQTKTIDGYYGFQNAKQIVRDAEFAARRIGDKERSDHLLDLWKKLDRKQSILINRSKERRLVRKIKSTIGDLNFLYHLGYFFKGHEEIRKTIESFEDFLERLEDSGRYPCEKCFITTTHFHSRDQGSQDICGCTCYMCGNLVV